jgi:hypothetical protein
MVVLFVFKLFLKNSGFRSIKKALLLGAEGLSFSTGFNGFQMKHFRAGGMRQQHIHMLVAKRVGVIVRVFIFTV